VPVLQLYRGGRHGAASLFAVDGALGKQRRGPRLLGRGGGRARGVSLAEHAPADADATHLERLARRLPPSIASTLHRVRQRQRALALALALALASAVALEIALVRALALALALASASAVALALEIALVRALASARDPESAGAREIVRDEESTKGGGEWGKVEEEELYLRWRAKERESGVQRGRPGERGMRG